MNRHGGNKLKVALARVGHYWIAVPAEAIVTVRPGVRAPGEKQAQGPGELDSVALDSVALDSEEVPVLALRSLLGLPSPIDGDPGGADTPPSEGLKALCLRWGDAALDLIVDVPLSIRELDLGCLYRLPRLVRGGPVGRLIPAMLQLPEGLAYYLDLKPFAQVMGRKS